MRTLPVESVDSVVTDPPYHLTSIIKRFGKAGSAPAKSGATGAYARASKGFMGKTWDGGDVAFRPETWAEVLRVLKPGGHLLAFSGTRTYHRMACAIEDAGFEIRDTIAWLYGSGFPKSHDISKKAEGWHGWGTALKPALEPIVVARKPIGKASVAANVVKHGTGAINVDGCRAAITDAGGTWGARQDSSIGYGGTEPRGFRTQRHEAGRWPANVLHDGSDEVIEAFAAFGDGQADRFFYSAKAGDDDRIGSKHPTVKPVALIRWLVRLVTPPGGTVLDPFAGTGTTGAAALREGMRAILIEREPEYLADIDRRLKRMRGEDGPLFTGGTAA